MPDAIPVFDRYISRDEAERYAAGVTKVARGVKIVVRPERMFSFDTNKDETVRTATQV